MKWPDTCQFAYNAHVSLQARYVEATGIHGLCVSVFSEKDSPTAITHAMHPSLVRRGMATEELNHTSTETRPFLGYVEKKGTTLI